MIVPYMENSKEFKRFLMRKPLQMGPRKARTGWEKYKNAASREPESAFVPGSGARLLEDCVWYLLLQGITVTGPKTSLLVIYWAT
jgi:hypothetical protein